MILEIINDTDLTLKEPLGYLVARVGHQKLIGTSEEVVNQMKIWFNKVVVDEFNLTQMSLLLSLEDFIEMVVPELQRRGVFKCFYKGATLREHLSLTDLNR